MKKNQTLLGLILTIGLFVGFVGCNKDPVTLTGITLNTETVKTEYTVGDEFTTEGLVVTANYSNGTSKEVVNWTTDGFDSTVATESQTITISYTEDGETVTATYTIVIKENDADTPVDDDPADEGDKPAGEGDKPEGEGDKPADEGDKPEGEGDKPADEGDKPAGEGDKPAGEGDKPEGEGDKPEGEGDKPEGEGDKPEGEGDAPAEDNPPVKATFQITYETIYGSVEPKTVEEDYLLTAEDLPALTQIGYVFGGWNLKVGDKITAATKITATWTPATNTAYKVEHYQQNLADEKYTIVTADTENKTGTTQADTSAEAKKYPGFTAKTFKQEKIAADGSTVVQIYYDRNSYTIKFDTDGGTKINDITLKFGETVTAPANPTKKGSVFDKWNITIPTTMPAENITIKATWQKVEPSFDISVDSKNEIELTFSVININTICFEVPQEYESYAWYVNGELFSEETSKKFNAVTNSQKSGEWIYKNGINEILVVVKDSNGLLNSAKALFIVDNE